MTTLESFAQTHRLHIRRDECGDPIIPGRRGHLYFDRDTEGALCLMVLDGFVSKPSSWKALGGKLWLGDISPHPKTGKRVQDVKVTGIPLENAKGAIRMARVRIKKQFSEAQREVLVKAGARTRFQSVEPIVEPQPVPESQIADKTGNRS